MKNLRIVLWQAIFGLTPLIYLISIWNDLPDQVPVHYNANFEVDRMGSKFEILGVQIFLFALSVGLSLLLINIHKFDPKKRYADGHPLMQKITWASTVFMSAISFYMAYDTENYSVEHKGMLSPKYIMALIALLFVVLGNFMNSIKPNYFVGIRTPWTLHDEDNWRKTHQLGSKLWFFGGLLMFVFVLIVPVSLMDLVIIGSTIPLAIIPIWYSYHLFRQKNKAR
jgi:uncharacterized membrane protein